MIKLVNRVVDRFYPIIRKLNLIEDVCQTTWSLGFSETYPIKLKLRIISRACRKVIKELGLKRRGKRVEGEIGFIDPAISIRLTEIDLEENWEDWLGRVPDWVLAAVRGVSVQRIYQIRRKLGISSALNRRFQENLSELFESYGQLARRMGRSRNSIRNRIRREKTNENSMDRIGTGEDCGGDGQDLPSGDEGS